MSIDMLGIMTGRLTNQPTINIPIHEKDMSRIALAGYPHPSDVSIAYFSHIHIRKHKCPESPDYFDHLCGGCWLWHGRLYAQGQGTKYSGMRRVEGLVYEWMNEWMNVFRKQTLNFNGRCKKFRNTEDSLWKSWLFSIKVPIWVISVIPVYSEWNDAVEIRIWL